MEKQHLINNTYQVVDNDDNVLFQGSESECNEYIMDQGMENLLNRINNNPELLDKRNTLTDIAAELYGDMFVIVDEFWGSPTERQMSIVDDELAELGWEPETTPEIEALAEILLQDLVDRGILEMSLQDLEDRNILNEEEDEDDEEFSQ